MFLTCLSQWAKSDGGASGEPSGPTVLLYPRREIFYTEEYPQNNKLSKFWCFMFDKYSILGFGENESLAVLHSEGQIISHVRQVGQEIVY